MAPVAATGAAGVTAAAGVAARLFVMEEEDEDAADTPVSVPEAIAAALADSLFAAAMAAMLSATVGEVVLGIVAVAVVVTSWPPEVEKTAGVPVSAEVGTDVPADAAPEDVAGVVPAPEVVPSMGTEAAAPGVVLALM